MKSNTPVIARRARAATERFARRWPDIGYPDDLGCYCAIGSYILAQALVGSGIPARLVVGFWNSDQSKLADDQGDCHCWVEAGGNSIDITATQFWGIEKTVLMYRVGGWKYRRRYLAVNREAQRLLQPWGDQNPWEHKQILDKIADNLVDKSV